MARRRFQDPKPKREGNYWYLRVWQDAFVGGVSTRKRQRIKIAPASTPERGQEDGGRDVAPCESGTGHCRLCG
jgi:hypothetical protein